MITSYISGIIATLTPCTVVIIPIFLYRFGIWGENKSKNYWLSILKTILGFFLSLIVIGVFFEKFSNGNLSSIFRLTLGTIIIAGGVLQLAGMIHFKGMSNVSNTFVLGLVLPWIISFSPCVLPIFLAMVANSSMSGKFLLSIISFGFGILSPALLSALMGKTIFDLLKKTTQVIAKLEKYSGFLMIGSGIYLNFQTLSIVKLDIIITSVFFSLIILGIAYFTFIVQKQIRKSSILILIGFVILWISVVFNCYSSILENPITGNYMNEVVSCQQYADEPCEICNRCATLFSIAALFGASGYIMSQGGWDKIKKNLKRIKIKTGK